MTTNTSAMQIPMVSMRYGKNGVSKAVDDRGMRPMQQRAYSKRGSRYLLIKSPPASGKSRALMFIALDKLHHQGVQQALILVPERSIGSSFHSTKLSEHGFFTDWQVEPRWNLCDFPGEERSKVESVRKFLESDAEILVCTHATFRFAFDTLGPAAFNNRLLAVDEFHHVSSNPDNKLGEQLVQLLDAEDEATGQGVHIVAMTGSYFRGDAEAVLSPEHEAKFETVTYTYYEQLNGYEYLKDLDIGYYFYADSYVDALPAVIQPDEKTIIHIPSVNSRESSKNKYGEVDSILDVLGEFEGVDPETGFGLVRHASGKMLRVADLVTDTDPAQRSKVLASLNDPAHRQNREHVDIIIALGMAKEGFDWVWCEHALTIGYRSSLTEVVQIIGRTTRDAPGKTRARFTNLIAEPTAEEGVVAEAVNDTLKAISASLLMEQVLAPRFEFRAKRAGGQPEEGFDYGPDGYQEDKCNIGYDARTGQVQVEIRGLAEPQSAEARRICEEDLHEVISGVLQDTEIISRGVFDRDQSAREVTQVQIGKIVRSKYPHLEPEDQEAIRQHAVALVNLTQQARDSMEVEWSERMESLEGASLAVVSEDSTQATVAKQAEGNLSFIDGVRRYALDVRELEIDWIDAINPFQSTYSILSKTMNETSLRQLEAYIGAKRTTISPDEALDLAKRAAAFKQERGRLPLPESMDAWERRLAEGTSAYFAYHKEGRYERS